MKKYKKNKKLTRRYLQNAAYRYLERYATTEVNFKFILKRKAERILADDENFTEKYQEAVSWIENIVDNCVKNKLVDDELYAASRVNAFLISGNSISIIKNKLRSKGVPSEVMKDVIERVIKDKPDLNLISGIKYAKKRRFGPFRIRERDENTYRKEQASMARAGFSYEETVKVLKATREELEDILYEN